MEAFVLRRPTTFDRVDRVKQAVGQHVLPGDERIWILGQPLVLSVDTREYEIPRGFTTDGASIPTIGQWLTGWGPWDEPQRWAAIAHDYLYCVDGVAKKFSDTVFREVLRSEGANLYQREVMYLAVVLFGHKAYRQDQEQGPSIWA